MDDRDKELMIRMVSELNSQVKALIQLQKSQQFLLRSLVQEKKKRDDEENCKLEGIKRDVDASYESLMLTSPSQLNLSGIHNDVLLSSSPIDYGLNNSPDQQLPSPFNIVKRSLSALIVVDDPTSQTLLAEHLASLSITLEIVSSCQQALGLVARTFYDVILLEITKSEDIDGIMMAWTIREFDPVTPIISITTMEERNTKWNELKNAGINEVLVKPVSLDDLSKVLGKYCKLGSNPATGDHARKSFSFNPNGLLPSENNLF